MQRAGLFDNKERGSAFIYILIAIALLAALTASFMRPASQQTTAQNTYQAITGLKSQIDFIQSAIQECILTYPSGDDSDTPALLATSVTQPYPLTPTHEYFTLDNAPTFSADRTALKTDDNVESIACPGNPGDSKDHVDIFGGSSGKFLPPPPDLFSPWEYYNDTDGIFYFTETSNTDAFIQTAFAKLDEQFAECQADVIDASGGQLELTSVADATDPKCSAGATCFRFWMITKGTAIYPGDADGEEVGCP
ncbi:MAG: hypothetical protein AAGB32_02340 [Pseudomonadota bacterium]